MKSEATLKNLSDFDNKSLLIVDLKEKSLKKKSPRSMMPFWRMFHVLERDDLIFMISPAISFGSNRLFPNLRDSNTKY